MGLSLILGLATWLVMRRRQINSSGSSDMESPYGHKEQHGYGGGPRGLHASECSPPACSHDISCLQASLTVPSHGSMGWDCLKRAAISRSFCRIPGIVRVLRKDPGCLQMQR